MKRQMIALVAGAAILATPLMTKLTVAQPGAGGEGPRMEKLAKKLNLTDAQETQLKAIRERTQSQIRSVLTAEQQAKFDAARAEHQKQREARQASGERGQKGERKGPHDMMQALNLTDAQKAKIKAIHEAAKAEMKTVLTAEQQAQLDQMKQRRQGRKGGQKGTAAQG